MPSRRPDSRQALTPTCTLRDLLGARCETPRNVVIVRRREAPHPGARIRGRTSTLKTVILAGGMGTRLSEETTTRPKPMVEIGGRPILWHIMKIFANAGLDEFVLALGY